MLNITANMRAEAAKKTLSNIVLKKDNKHDRVKFLVILPFVILTPKM